MSAELMPALIVGAPTALLLAAVVWIDQIKPRLDRRRALRRRMGIGGHI